MNNYASKPIEKEVKTVEEMMINLQEIRRSLGLTSEKKSEGKHLQINDLEID